MANEEALLELVNVIGEARERGEWDQTSWATETACGTTCCAAGWKAKIDGKQFAFFPLSNGEKHAVKLVDGTYIAEYAAEALELTDDEAIYLFHDTYDNDYDSFVVKVKEVINGEIR